MARTLAFVLLGLLATVEFAGGCGSASTSGLTVPGDGGSLQPYEPDAADAGFAVVSASPSEAAAAVAPAAQGSPLCNASPYVGGCYPDLPTTAQACGYDSSDGGDSNPTAALDTPLACYVQMTPDAGLAPKCALAGTGVDGAGCAAGTDCAPGRECVGAAGTCRHYCCAGNTACDPDEFCDIQATTQDPGIMVPVCMPQTPCVLLQDTCPAGEACQVVRENGATSCVTVGTAKAGDACDSDHCAAGLVCIGATGARRCYTLCHTATMAECAQGHTCTGGLPLFTDPAVGWCH